MTQYGGRVDGFAEKYSDDQPRDEGGRWNAVPGAGTHHSRPDEHKAGPVKLKATKERAFNGEPVPTKIKLSNKETDKITEAVIIQHLRAQGFKDAAPGRSGGMKDAEVATTVRYGEHGYSGGNHYAVDVYADHIAVEMKGGQVSNSKSAEQWRIKYGQEPKFMASWSTEKKQEYRQALATKCLKDKEKARQWLEKDRGVKVQAVTYTAIVNPDTRHVDVFRFNGYHLRLSWLHAEDAFVKSYRY
jgi:hypothetical protein